MTIAISDEFTTFAQRAVIKVCGVGGGGGNAVNRMIASGLKEAATLANEFQNMRVKIDLRTAHDSYTTWRDGQHDDLVLAVALASWWAEKRPMRMPKPIVIGSGIGKPEIIWRGFY